MNHSAHLAISSLQTEYSAIQIDKESKTVHYATSVGDATCCLDGIATQTERYPKLNDDRNQMIHQITQSMSRDLSDGVHSTCILLGNEIDSLADLCQMETGQRSYL